MSTQVWLAGATGLVGRQVLALLAGDPRVKVLVIARRETSAPAANVTTSIVEFAQLGQAELGACDVAVCCLGTTLRRAGSREGFRQVDFDYVLAFAAAAQRAGAKHVVVVSSLGANPKSSVFYNRVKGEMEEALFALGLPAVTVVRPSLLLGKREEMRIGERMAMPLSRFLPLRWRGIGADVVAGALRDLALSPASGTRVVESDELQRWRAGS